MCVCVCVSTGYLVPMLPTVFAELRAARWDTVEALVRDRETVDTRNSSGGAHVKV